MKANKPISVFDVAIATGIGVERIMGAMRSGTLAWKFWHGNPVTISTAVELWKSAAAATV